MNSETVIIRAPQNIPAAMVVAYVDRCKSGMPQARNALSASDFPFLNVFGHRLSGTGAAYGLTELTRLARAVEQAAIVGNGSELERQLMAMEEYLSRVEVAAA